MSVEAWLKSILEAALRIADRKAQEDAWLTSGERKSSPDEVFQMLMEDSVPDEFFRKYSGNYSAAQLDTWHEFRTKLYRFYDKMPIKVSPKEVLADPEWDDVRQAAGRFVEAFAPTAPLR